MNKLLLSILITSLLAISSYAQITHATIQHIDDSSSVETPIKYDGISNICWQKRSIDYQQYIGLRAYLVTKSKYFTIVKIDVTIREILNTDQDGNVAGDFLSIKLKSENTEELYNYETYLIHGNQYHREDNGNIRRFDYLVLVPYFLKEKELHDGEQYILVNSKGCFYDEAREQLITYNKPLFGGIWKCEVNMYIKVKDEDLEQLTYFFKDTEGHVVVKDIMIVKELDGSEYYSYYPQDGTANTTHFMPLKVYLAILNEDKKRNSTNANNKSKAIKALTAKYGNENVQLVLKGKVKIGMNDELCSIAWGGLYGILIRTEDGSGTFEVWKHALYGTKLYFKNGKLYKIVD